MDKDAFALFFAILTVLCNVFVLAALLGALAVRFAPTSALANKALDVRDVLAPEALWFAWVIATVTMLGSLYLSEIADYPPCKLCWFQRICMYPLTVLLLVAAITKDRRVHRYVLPLAGIGSVISIYHYQLERFPEQSTLSCQVDVPCTTVWIWKFHYISIPLMALSAFAAIITLVLMARTADGLELDPDHDAVDDDVLLEGAPA